ncbi:hypothetical protein HHI36_002808 [Cryptolaemus montrouzieri]|uniref:Uncharacterized protein n=1 Tax=Cryptolaemus montrouzieri TaxID=559131 RepID=A0ABD2PBV3_9CUCU
MAEESLLSSANMEDMSDDEFEDESQAIKKLYLKQNLMYTKVSSDSQKKSTTPNTSSEIVTKLPNKLEHLTYQDLRLSSEDNLKYVIKHPLSFNAPILQKPGFEKRSLREQVKFLCSYHTKLSKNIAKQARLEVECVPLPKLFKASPKCNLTLSRNINGNDSEDEIENNNISPFDDLIDSQPYVSRSGRITKRKFYSEATDFDFKKLKVQDNEWNIKKSPAIQKCTGRGRKPASDFDGKTIENKNISKKNLEIMSKSAFFKEKEQINRDRMAKIAEGVELKKIKDKEEEARIESFENSLLNIEDLDESITDNDDSVIRRRVTPPLPKSKGSKQKKLEYAELELTAKKGKPAALSKPQTDKPSNGPTHNQKKSSQKISNETISSTSGIKKSNKKMIECPICSRDFEEADIEAHASSCGENTMETRSRPVGHSKMTCQHCDKVFLFDNEYENHVKTCSCRSSFH